jgi:hypothetical protein
MNRNVIIRKNVNSIIQFAQIILDLKASWFPDVNYPDIWYRGVKDAAFDLLPGAYFRPDCDELSLVLHFRSLSPSLLSREPLDDWEWYYLMQHYGIPTRLLDWTESPLAALYFALEEDATRRSPCVWVMDPLSLNGLSGEEYILFPYPDTDLKYWLPDFCGARAGVHTFSSGERFKDNSKPLAIYPKRYNPRIVAQRGVFTVHGMERTPINHLPFTDKTGRGIRLAKIIFKPNVKQNLRDHLWTLGFSKTAIYPEPQSLADDLKKAFYIR